MKALIQRVSSAHVSVNGNIVGQIGKGLLVLVCAMKGDTKKDLEYLARKVANLRVFYDNEGKMNLSLIDVEGAALVISQFTLAARTRKGNRPSFDDAESPDKANEMYELFVQELRNMGVPVETGIFAADMSVSLVNDGPVTVMIDSREEKK
jgi:D-tyrosyl-tRNA(Tyr) deacylase